MSGFQDIAKKIAAKNIMTKPPDKAELEKINIEGSEQTLIGYSDNYNLKLDITGYDDYIPYPDIFGEDANDKAGNTLQGKPTFNYYTKTSVKNTDAYGEMVGFNIAFARKHLKALDDAEFNNLFKRKIWGEIKSTAAIAFAPEDYFYFFAGALQVLIDPHWENLINLEEIYEDQLAAGSAAAAAAMSSFNPAEVALDEKKYQRLVDLIPNLFRDYLKTHDDDSMNGTYAGVFQLGPSSIERIKDQDSINSTQQFLLDQVKRFWYRVLGSERYSYNPPGNDKKLADSFESLETILQIFDLATILNLQDDLANNIDLYKDYEQDWKNRPGKPLGSLTDLTFEEANYFWTVFIEKYLAGDINNEVLEELEKEAVEASDIFVFDPDSCGIPPEEIGEEDLCLPTCKPNPDATVVDWTTAPNEEPYLNEKVCEYWVPVTTKYDNVNERPVTAIINDQIENGIKLILDFVGKESTEDIILSLAPQITTDYFVDFRTKSKVKVLIKLPFDATMAIESKESKEADETTDSSEFPLNVVLTSKDIKSNGSMLNIVSRAIGNKYSVQYEILRFRGTSSGLPQDILLKKEGDRIRQFKKALIDLLKAQNFKFNPTRKKNGVLEAVEIGFKEDFKGIEYIKANNIGCEAVELGTNKDGVIEGGAGWKSFLKRSMANYPTTLAFIANLPAIYDNVTADSPMVVDSFLKTYYFPRIEETIGEELTMTQQFIDENDCNTAEVVANLLKPAAILGSEVAGTALSFPELWLKSIPQKTCLTVEGKRQQDEKYNAIDDIEQRWKDANLREIFTGDAIFGDLEHKLGEVSNLKELYSEILDKLGVCGLSALAMGAMGCLLKGLDIEVSMSMLVKSFIKNATEKEMEKVFFAFHPGLQQFIRDSVAELTSIPLPWEAGYRSGSYQAAGVKYSADYSSASGSIEARLEKTEEKDPEKLDVTTDDEENLKNFRARTKTTIQEQEDKFKSSDPVPSGKLDADGNEIMVAPPDRVSAAPGLGPRSFAGPFAHAGSVGTALDNIQDNAIDHLKTAILKAIQEEIISGEAMMSFIDKVPGAELLKGAISETLECPFPPLFSPPLDDILKTLELDFCGGHYAITLPLMRKIRVRPFLGDIATIIIEAAEDALEKLVMQAMVTILKKILSISLNVSCEVLKDAAGIAKDIAGGSDFREIVAENICGDSLNDDELNASLNKLNESLGSLGLPGVPKPTDQDMGDFMDGVSAILNQQELLNLLDGEPTDQAVAYVRQIVNGIPNLAAALPTDDHIRNLFTGMGKIFDRNKIRDRIRATSYKPISPSVCASPEHLAIFSDVRCSILSEKGMTPEQCEEQLEKLKDRAMLDFEDLANALNENYFGDLDIQGTPECPDSGIYPREDPETKKQTQELFSSTDDAINAVFMTELTSKRGLLNMILADTNGRGFKVHNEFWVKMFGDPNSGDFGPFGFYAHEDNGKGNSLLIKSPVNMDVRGVYPEDVAPYLKGILAGGLDVPFELSEDPNLSLNFENWDIYKKPDGSDVDPDAPEFVKVDYNYQKDNDTIINMRVHSQDDKFGPPLEFDVIQSYDSDLLENIIDLGGSSPNASGRPLDTTNQAYIFGNLVASGLYPYTREQISEINSFCASTLYEYITSKIIEKFALKISKNTRTFNFGYDSNANATVVPLDHTQYGGTEKNPAFYIEPPKYTGWMGIYDKLIPPVECGEEPILNFNSISQKTTEYNDKLKDDPRLEIPAACGIDSERPFDRIMPRASLAGTDGAIRSTVRLYVMEAFLRGLPSFSLFDPKFPQVYNDTLLSYIAADMKEGLINTGLNFKKRASRERYYYTFLEEVVQNFGKKVDLEMIVPSPAQVSAMETINDLQAKWRRPSRKPRITYKKRLKDKWISQIKHVESSCLILLNHYISEQIEEVSKLFSDALKPSIPNLESLIFGSPDWMVAGAITANGPMDVATNPLNPYDPTTEKILNLEPGYTISIGSSEPYAEGYFPFILEKYIKLTPTAENAVLLDPQIFGLEYWRRELQNDSAATTTTGTTKSLSPEVKIKSLEDLGTWSYGLRISVVLPQSLEGAIDNYSFQTSISGEDVYKTKSLKFGDSSTNTKYVIPIVIAEVPIESRTLTTDLIDQYDINCMISELINTPEYKTLFNYCFPLQSLLSLVTIYTIETFLLSIGEEWRDKVNKRSQFRRWDKEGNFKKTKKNLRRLFEGFYHSRDSSYKDEEAETGEEQTRKNIKVKKAVPTDSDIKWWKKRLQVPKPAEECE
jgi:hypothetical protein